MINIIVELFLRIETFERMEMSEIMLYFRHGAEVVRLVLILLDIEQYRSYHPPVRKSKLLFCENATANELNLLRDVIRYR